MAGPTSSAAAPALQQFASTASGPLKNTLTTMTATASSSWQVAPNKLESYFSQSQMSLALTLAKTIPEGFSMKEYQTQLQRSIIQNNPEIQNQPLRHVDSCEFWKNQYERIYQENKELGGKVRALEEKQRDFERNPSPDLGGQEGSRSSRKHPADLEELEEWLEGQEPDLVLPIGDDYLSLSSYILRIGRNRRDLKRIAKDSNIPDHIDTLWRATCDLLKLLGVALSDCSTPLWSLKCNDEPQTVFLLQQAMHQVALGCLSCFEALNELARTIPGRKRRFEIVNGLVAFFNKALDHLHTVSGLQAERENEQRGILCNKRAKTEQSEYAVNKYLSVTLVQVCQADWKIGQLGHSEILEGILYSVLNHTGHLLSHTIFEEHVAASGKRGDISVGSTSPATAATKFEFRYIIPILHAALGGTARKDLVAQVLGDSRRLGRSADQHGSLVSKAKKLMQETLIRSAVGADVEGLKLPVQTEAGEVYSPSVSHRAEKYESEWFLESVWALVGWELAL